MRGRRSRALHHRWVLWLWAAVVETGAAVVAATVAAGSGVAAARAVVVGSDAVRWAGAVAGRAAAARRG
jgi:hypothetical protein